MFVNSIVVAVFCSLIFTGVAAIKCFQCNSAVEPDCEHLTSVNISHPYYKECTGINSVARFCRKIKHTSKEPVVRFYRQCGWHSNRTDDTCKTRDTDFILEQNCVCRTDGCNSSMKAIPNLPTLSVLILAATFICRLFY